MGVLDLMEDVTWLSSMPENPRKAQAASILFRTVRTALSVSSRFFIPAAVAVPFTPHPGYGISRIGGGIHSPFLGALLFGPAIMTGARIMVDALSPDPSLEHV